MSSCPWADYPPRRRRVFTVTRVLIFTILAGVGTWLVAEVGGYSTTVYRREVGGYTVSLAHRYAGLRGWFEDELVFAVHRGGRPVVGPSYRGVAWTNSYQITDRYYPDLGVLLLVERSRPGLVIAALDCSCRTVWPDYSLDEGRYAVGEAILKKVNARHGTSFELTDFPLSHLTP
jgi:hypothetical protein